MPKAVILTFGKGVAKKHSVRMEPIAIEINWAEDKPSVTLDSEGLGDYYVSRDIMNALGLKDGDSIKITIEAV